MSEPNQEIDKPSWLSELQQKSWEPEILLSGIVLYGMFQAPDLLDRFYQYATLNIYDNASDVQNLVTILKVALYWLTFGLILHLVSRGIWVGMVGLSFTFPDGINKENLKLSPKFEKAIDRIPPIEKIIINLEKISSSLFSISFMLFMMMIGTYFFFLVMLIIPVLSFIWLLDFKDFTYVEGIIIAVYSMIILGIGFMSLIDFLTLGYLKRIKWLSKIYYPIYRLMSMLTFSRFYRPIYYTIVTNFGKWKIALFLIAFTAISFIGLDKASHSTIPGEEFTRIEMWSNTVDVANFSGHYDDQNDDFHSVKAQIQSDIISENTLRLFVVMELGLEDSIRKNCQYDTLRKKLDTASAYVKNMCVKQFYQVKLDDQQLGEQDWLFHYKQKTNQRGIMSYIDISDLDKGLHYVTIKGPDHMYKGHIAKVPFYREISNTGYYVPKKTQEEDSESYLKLKKVLPK